MARNGYEGQQTTKDRLDNLYDPVPGSFGAQGRFDSESRERSITGWLGRHQIIPAVAGMVAGIITAGLLMRE